MGPYREEFVKRLLATPEVQVTIRTGDRYFGNRVNTPREDLGIQGHPRLRNCFLFGQRALFQLGATIPTVQSDAAVIEFNPRILNSWLVLLLRRLIRKPTALWGHLYSRSGRGSATNLIRRLMARLAHTLIVYTYEDASHATEWLPPARIAVAPNALYSAETLLGTEGQERHTDVICIGRLTADKKPHLALAGFSHAKEQEWLPTEATLHLVGPGSNDAYEAGLVAAARRRGDVILHGPVTDLSVLRSLFDQSLVAVSPGYAGLNVTQALSFGVPIIVAEGEPHAPEISLLHRGTGSFFPSDDAVALGVALGDIFAKSDEWTARRPLIQQETLRCYSVEAMVAGFLRGAFCGVD
jgi:glycosyltransferase involved in cell wall biosynthesis